MTAAHDIFTTTMDADDVHHPKQNDANVMPSPPPEEELRQLSKSNKRTSIFSPLPATPTFPLLNSSRVNLQQEAVDSPSASNSNNRNNKVKRKRSIAASSPLKASTSNQAPAPVTPNPRLRKQTKHSSISPAKPRRPDVTGSPLSKQQRSSLADPSASPTRQRGPRSPTILASPHLLNPDADYIPPSLLTVSGPNTSYRRRSVTPIPPYEPPKERFTPPREILLEPPASSPSKSKKTQKRVTVKVSSKAGGVHRGSTPVLPIKLEPPEIDLSVPPPPPSPTDDPILLVGSARSKTRVQSRLRASHRKSPTPVVQSPTQKLPTKHVLNSGSDIEDADMDIDAELPQPDYFNSSSSADYDRAVPSVFNFDFVNENADDVWSDSDDEAGPRAKVLEGEGEFTGRFQQYREPVKMQDPPSSATRVRMDDWGRPISPHPKLFGGDASVIAEEEEDEGAEVQDSPSVSKSRMKEDARRVSGRLPEEEDATDEDGGRGEHKMEVVPNKMRTPLTLSEIEEMKFGNSRKSVDRDEVENGADADSSDDEGDAEPADREDSMHHDETQDEEIVDEASRDEGHAINDIVVEDATEDNSIADGGHAQAMSQPLNSNPDEEHAGRSPLSLTPVRSRESSVASSSSSLARRLSSKFEIFDVRPIYTPSGSRQSSLEPGGAASSATLVTKAHVDQERDIEAGSDSDDEGDESDVSIIKIVSSDPMAAARAAAILKLHDYDMIEREKRRRRTVADNMRKFRRKSALESGVSKSYTSPRKARRQTFADVSMPELLKEAEHELRNTPVKQCSRVTPVPQSPVIHGSPHSGAMSPVTTGPRDWTKADWKRLDSCFTDERYHLAAIKGLPMGALASVDDVDDANVVERFADDLGGYAVLERFGASWTMERISMRVQSLRKKQRSGLGAPPTPSLASRLTSLSPSSSMIVPDFTPTPLERLSRLHTNKPVLPPPETPTMFNKPSVPPFILGPRYSHLREEVPVSEVPREKADIFGSGDTGSETELEADEESSRGASPTPCPTTASTTTGQPPPSAVKRSLSYLTSWLRPSSQKQKHKRNEPPRAPALPVPPTDVLGKPRGPVNTPSKKPAAKVTHPKELVELQHTTPPPEPSRIPRKKEAPKRLVELNHLRTPQPKDDMPRKSIPRRSSTASVRDLVSTFEKLDEESQRSLSRAANRDLQRVRSIEGLKGKGKGKDVKPAWRF